MTNPMLIPMLDKVVVHIGVGESGERLELAENILRSVTGQGTIRTISKMKIPAFDIKVGEPIGCKTTLRGESAVTFLKTALGIVNSQLYSSQFDQMGNVSFGIEEHTDFPGMAYDPNVGIYGMDVIVVLKRPGYRVSRRRIQKAKVPTRHRLTTDEGIAYMTSVYGIEVV